MYIPPKEQNSNKQINDKYLFETQCDAKNFKVMQGFIIWHARSRLVHIVTSVMLFHQNNNNFRNNNNSMNKHKILQKHYVSS